MTQAILPLRGKKKKYLRKEVKSYQMKQLLKIKSLLIRKPQRQLIIVGLKRKKRLLPKKKQNYIKPEAKPAMQKLQLGLILTAMVKRIKLKLSAEQTAARLLMQKCLRMATAF